MKTKLWYAFLLLTSVAFSQVSNPVTSGLLRSYEFTNAQLSEGNSSNDFTQSGTALTGVSDHLNGNNNAVNIGADVLTAPGFFSGNNNGRGSVSFWIKTYVNDANERVILQQVGTGGSGFQLYLKDGKIGMSVKTYANTNYGTKTFDTKRLSSTFVANNLWHHIVVTVNASPRRINANPPTIPYTYQFVDHTINFYVDNGAAQTFTASPRSVQYAIRSTLGNNYSFVNGGNLQISTGTATTKFEQTVDDIYIYNKVLSATEVSSLYSYNRIVNILDSNFKTELLNHTPAIDSNSDNEIQVSEAANFSGTSINVDGKNIADLTGIEEFRITNLSCANNIITEIDLSKNVNLTEVNCSNNSQLRVVDIANGNNASIISFNATGNTNLSCIKTDTGFTPASPTWQKDNSTVYGDACFFTLTSTINNVEGVIVANPSPNSNGEYLYGTSVMLTVNPNTGYQFDSWTGDASGNTNPLSLTIDADKNVTANMSYIPNTIYVNATASGNNDGTSWTNAYTSLHDALANASVGGDHIWVAKGTYKPHASNRSISFNVNKPNTKVYGGFTGNETTLAGRDKNLIHTTNATILSGDLLGNDAPVIGYNASGDRIDNSYHVLTISQNNVTVDGFTISDGHGNSAATSGNTLKGSGVYTTDAVGFFTLTNSVIKKNSSRYGSGVYLGYNGTTTRGNFVIDRCVFDFNLGEYGAAMYAVPESNASFDITVTNSLFTRNESRDNTGANGRGGICFMLTKNGSAIDAKFTNNTFTNNVHRGTATGDQSVVSIAKQVTNGTANLTLSNSIFWGNTTGTTPTKSVALGRGSYSISATNNIYNSVDEDDFSSVATANKFNTTNTNPNLDADFKPQGTSLSIINMGDNTKIPTGVNEDLMGEARIYNGIVDIGAYEYATGPITVTTWSGTSSTWSDVTNWSNGIPTNMLDAYIPNGVVSYPAISGAMTAKDVTIENAASLTIEPTGSLTAENITTNDNLTLQSNATHNASLTATSVTGNATYERYVSGDWHVIGSPVGGQDIASFVTASSLATGSANPNNIGLAIYDNTIASPWTYYQATFSWGNFVKGKGYAVKRDNATGAGTVNFTGTVETGNYTYTNTVGSSTNTFEMISNPYTSYVSVSDFLGANTSNIKNTNAALYFWDDSASSYVAVNSSSTTTTHVAPGQGFFVQTANIGDDIEFTTSMLSHQTSGALMRPAQQTVVNISIASGKTSKSTKIKYLSNTNNGLDVGYDAGYFDAGQATYGIYTQLVDGSYADTNFMLQCVNDEKVEETVIPLGVKTDGEREVTFSASAMNLPNDINVYLEDTQTGSMVSLANGNTYKATVTAGTGRFYVHTKANASLSTKDVTLNNIAIYKTANNSLAIRGLKEKANVSMYSVLGKEILSRQVSQSNTNIVLPSLATGMYLVNIKTESAQVSKKIILE